MHQPSEPQEIACQQVLINEESVFSTQWMVIPGRYAGVVTPGFLIEKYLAYIKMATLSIIRPVVTTDGIEFRFFSTPLCLLEFKPAVMEDPYSITLAIKGGFLVQREQCRRGQLTFVAKSEGENLRVMLRLSDYCPLLLGNPRPSAFRKWLYRLTQGFIHKKVTVSFLARIYREVAGEEACFRIVRVKSTEGSET